MKITECFFAINLTKFKWGRSADAYLQTYRHWRSDNLMLRVQDFLLPLKATGAAFGPFQTNQHAEAMPASTLDEHGKDFFGDRWCIVSDKATEATEFIRPMAADSRLYVCSNRECVGVQRFKGSCSKCKSEGKEFIPTIEIRDWEGRLEARL
jgi:hypothetical protein